VGGFWPDTGIKEKGLGMIYLGNFQFYPCIGNDVFVIKRKEEWHFCYKQKRQGYYFILYIGNGKSTIWNDKSSIGIENRQLIWDNFFSKQTLLFPDGESTKITQQN